MNTFLHGRMISMGWLLVAKEFEPKAVYMDPVEGTYYHFHENMDNLFVWSGHTKEHVLKQFAKENPKDFPGPLFLAEVFYADAYGGALIDVFFLVSHGVRNLGMNFFARSYKVVQFQPPSA